ncbi:FtsX-like permease family protein [Glutamicibacter arilaitensis]|uniref:Permease n=1 Tax=Glutamicibacter arilaitensis TaxID=256701 RepID=A0A4Y8TZ30_9MICC|nr:FtsX-like permease family protein [Glutamicibacter arilaitensis]TFH56323.1 permease [Glutamicibacter arilaitensis]
MNILHLSWMLGRPAKSRLAPQLLTACAYAMVSAILLIVLGGAYSFTSFSLEAQSMYLPLAAFAVVLLVVPLLVLGSAAARLSARSNDRALSSLRLLGATGRQISLVAVLQAAGTALAGALTGVLLYFLVAPLASMLRFQGAPIGSAIYLPLWMLAIAVVAVVLVSAASAAAGLRKLVITPLAVATRRAVPTPGWLRAVIAVGGIAVLGLVFANMGQFLQSIAAIIAVVVGGFGFGLLIMNLIGPFLVSKVGKRKLRKANTPQELLSARMILESPAESWRQVSGVAMASFVAVVGGSGAAMMSMTDDGLSRGTWLEHVPADVTTGVLVTLAISFICVAASAAISQSASTLDRAELYRGLHRLGMPWATMNAARTKSIMIPALTASIGFAIASTVLVLPLAGAAIIFKPLTVITVVACVLLGMLLIRGAILVADPQKLLATRE